MNNTSEKEQSWDLIITPPQKVVGSSPSPPQPSFGEGGGIKGEGLLMSSLYPGNT